MLRFINHCIIDGRSYFQLLVLRDLQAFLYKLSYMGKSSPMASQMKLVIQKGINIFQIF